MTTVHRAVIGTRAAVTGIDRRSLASFANGEEKIVEEYDRALAQNDIHAATSALFKRQRKALAVKIDEMKSLAFESSTW